MPQCLIIGKDQCFAVSQLISLTFVVPSDTLLEMVLGDTLLVAGNLKGNLDLQTGEPGTFRRSNDGPADL